MPEDGGRPAPDRGELRRAVRERLRDLDESLQPLAEDLLAEESRIDLLARDREGRAVCVVIAERGEDDRALTRALAQLSWIESRVRDWLELAPALGLEAAAGARSWLLCPDFGPETLAVARWLSTDRLALARCLWRRRTDGLDLFLDPVRLTPPVYRPAPERAPGPSPLLAPSPRRAVFRSGLRDDDFQLTPAERRSLGDLGSGGDPTG